MVRLSNGVYDMIKHIVQIVLPAIGTLYFTLSTIWGAEIFPYAEQIEGTILAVSTFLGIVLKMSSITYEKEQKEKKCE